MERPYLHSVNYAQGALAAKAAVHRVKPGLTPAEIQRLYNLGR